MTNKRIALRLSERDAEAVMTIARKLSAKGSPFVNVSDVVRHALRIASEAAGCAPEQTGVA